MIQLLAGLLAGLQLLCVHLPSATVLAMKTGILLRMHVVAQDDTPAMQALKAPVRDAVRQVYAERTSPDDALPMLPRAAALLPELTQAAREAAREAGYTGEVSVTLAWTRFDRRTLDGLTFPAGYYPALMIRLGEARGQNWWGLIDPELALSAAALEEGGDAIRWDWSLEGLLAALFRLPLKVGDGDA
ncbi:MAG: stage II sporulation protein R [Aristaeellaceae bacterium]